LALDETTDFGRVHRSINSILNRIAPYSAEATLNPNETCEVPAGLEHVGGKCLIFDEWDCRSDEMVDSFGLLLVLEIFRSEMNFAREYGAAELFARLKKAGCYPYSDMDREAVA